MKRGSVVRAEFGKVRAVRESTATHRYATNSGAKERRVAPQPIINSEAKVEGHERERDSAQVSDTGVRRQTALGDQLAMRGTREELRVARDVEAQLDDGKQVLNRMRELSVEGSREDLDQEQRGQIEAEFQQLARQLEDFDELQQAALSGRPPVDLVLIQDPAKGSQLRPLRIETPKLPVEAGRDAGSKAGDEASALVVIDRNLDEIRGASQVVNEVTNQLAIQLDELDTIVAARPANRVPIPMLDLESAQALAEQVSREISSEFSSSILTQSLNNGVLDKVLL